MIIYEVNLEVNHEVLPEFKIWLVKHINEMLEIEGFLKCDHFEVENQTKDTLTFSLKYYLNSQSNLEKYFANHADRMRADGLNLFRDQFSASRRILKIRNTYYS